MQSISMTDDPARTQNILLPNGSTFTMTVVYSPQQSGWFIQNLVYGTVLTLNNLRISNQPNMLYQWKNIIPFGLACFSRADREPTQLEDFQSGASVLYLLNSDEVSQYTGFLDGSVTF